MKSKKTILLTVLVLVIWTTIGFKIFKGFNEDETDLVLPVLKKVKFEAESKDTYPLSLNYADPFLRHQNGKKSNGGNTSKRHSEPRKNQIIDKIDWGRMVYLGRINNATKKSTIASIIYETKDFLVKKGDIVEGFKIGNIYSDSIEVIFGSHIKMIKKKN
jgi:hypothetical protein